MPAPLPIAVLISGGGTTLRNLIERIGAGSLPVEIRVVVSSNPSAQGLEFAKAAGIKTLVVEKKKSLSAAEFSEVIFGACRAVGVE
jgi:phosphoribosylglycinamide formyltransferase 1